MKRTRKTDSEAQAYIRRIRNQRKRAYAEQYFRYLCSPYWGAAPERGDLSFMAAQAVEMNLQAILRGAEG